MAGEMKFHALAAKRWRPFIFGDISSGNASHGYYLKKC